MKGFVKAKAGIWLMTLVGCSIIFYSFGACNAPNVGLVTLTLDGPEYVGVGTTNDYTLTFSPSNVDTNGGKFVWSYTGFAVVGSDTSNPIKLVAPATPSNSATDKKTIRCEFSKDGWSSASECSAQKKVIVAQIAISDIVRAANLPFSLPPTKMKIVNVTISPTGLNTTFDIINGNADNGSAAVSANATRTSSGPIIITGGNQTKVGYAGKIQVRARINGNNCGRSKGFSICAHPSTIGFTYIGMLEPLQYGPSDLRWGAEYLLQYLSDSGTPGDCDKTKLSEIVTVTRYRFLRRESTERIWFYCGNRPAIR